MTLLNQFAPDVALGLPELFHPFSTTVLVAPF
jgi:hypothetical protein